MKNLYIIYYPVEPPSQGEEGLMAEETLVLDRRDKVIAAWKEPHHVALLVGRRGEGGRQG